jgi:LuxR family transcriptional regulator, maltose regulon positive regulatory protein
MLDCQPAEVKNLLLCTSVLDRVSGPLADVVTGESGGQRILQALVEDNAFVVSLDTARTWFRYHHLFADLLRLELRRTQPERPPYLHRAAAEWLADQGCVTEAVKHAQAGGD